MIDALVDGTGLQPEDIAFFTQSDGYGDDRPMEAASRRLKRHGLTDESRVLHVSYERNTMAVENALATLLYAEHEPRAVVMVGAYGPCAKFIKLALRRACDGCSSMSHLSEASRWRRTWTTCRRMSS